MLCAETIYHSLNVVAMMEISSCENLKISFNKYNPEQNYLVEGII